MVRAAKLKLAYCPHTGRATKQGFSQQDLVVQNLTMSHEQPSNAQLVQARLHGHIIEILAALAPQHQSFTKLIIGPLVIL